MRYLRYTHCPLLSIYEHLWNSKFIRLSAVKKRPQFAHKDAGIFRVQKASQINLDHFSVWILNVDFLTFLESKKPNYSYLKQWLIIPLYRVDCYKIQ